MPPPLPHPVGILRFSPTVQKIQRKLTIDCKLTVSVNVSVNECTAVQDTKLIESKTADFSHPSKNIKRGEREVG